MMSHDHSMHNMSHDHSMHNMSHAHMGHNMSGMTTATSMHNHGGHDMSNMGGGHDNHGPGEGDMGDMHSGMNMHMDMKMYFHTGITEYVLFENCHTTSTGGMVGACAVVFVAAILYEGLKFMREVLLQRSLKEEPRLTYGDKGLHQDDDGTRCSNVGSRMFSGSHFIQTFLHVVQVFVSYCLMLVFMTYNVWLCIAVVLGAGIGYFVFGWKRAVIVDANEHCH